MFVTSRIACIKPAANLRSSCCRRNICTYAQLAKGTPQPLSTRIQKAATTGLLSAALILGGTNLASAVPETSMPGSNAGFLSDEEIQLKRDELNFVRSFDGKVALKDHNGKLWDCKLDLKSPGTLLLREPSGLVHYLAFSSLSQVDLSDDEVVGAVAISGWEQGVEPVQDEDEKKQVIRLELTREGFYGLVSIVAP
ncbi:hypothetical protein DUNSADRAFT_4439 [Dunaliella salina]|uniref:Uncharacterized protein n=1 Tax=Dunaliella salina TaxID=3046 RepID=A0ABQ7GS05_DUNSA|nr:hypothetical protein DUNSADRAFT_4439 [Dunaliella salina]|eukprot:KAF5837391.1 hypothetical protein DUNSADRAFT_4439 [Dunaliella salina]